MGALQLAPFMADPFYNAQISEGSATPMYVQPPAQTSFSLGALALLAVAELYVKGGAAVSVNVYPEEVNEMELGPVISITHLPQRSVKTLTQDTDKELVRQLLLKVQETEPAAQMKWNEDERSWYISAPRLTKSKPAKVMHVALASA